MSPTVLRTSNVRIVVYPKDHNPPHVHVIGPRAEAKFRIEDLECYFNRGFSKKQLSRIKEFLKDKVDLCMEAWSEYEK